MAASTGSPSFTSYGAPEVPGTGQGTASEWDWDDTVICISSDHGELLGDHGDWAKSKPWEGSAHVPLVCAGGATGLVRRGAVVEAPVTTMDLAAT